MRYSHGNVGVTLDLHILLLAPCYAPQDTYTRRCDFLEKHKPMHAIKTTPEKKTITALSLEVVLLSISRYAILLQQGNNVVPSSY